MKIEIELKGKNRAMIGGARICREARGVWHVQNPVRPNLSSFTGTLREIERALKSKAVKLLS